MEASGDNVQLAAPPGAATAEPASTEAGPDTGRPAALDLLAGGLLAATVILHVVAMFPDYYSGNAPASIVSQPDQAALFSVLAAAWALALGFGLSAPRRVPMAAATAVAVAATELGFRVADLGQVFRYGTSQAGAGLWIMTAAWVLGAGAAALAVLSARRLLRARPELRPTDQRPPAVPRVWAACGVGVLSLATAGVFLPPWDHYRGVSSVTGQAVSFNLGNAFSEPWQVVLGNVICAVAIAAVPILAVLWMWRDKNAGAAAIAGVFTVLAAQFVAAVVQVDEAVSPAIAGISGSQARQLGLSMSLKLTGWFALDALLAFSMFVAGVALATLRPVQEDSPAVRPSAPDARSPATSAWS